MPPVETTKQPSEHKEPNRSPGVLQNTPTRVKAETKQCRQHQFCTVSGAAWQVKCDLSNNLPFECKRRNLFLIFKACCSILGCLPKKHIRFVTRKKNQPVDRSGLFNFSKQNSAKLLAKFIRLRPFCLAFKLRRVSRYASVAMCAGGAKWGDTPF